MKCKNKHFYIEGIKKKISGIEYIKTNFNVIITNDDIGKTITVADGNILFSFPADEISKYLQ